MSDALPEDAWVNNFLSSPPKPLQLSLQKRLHASTTHLNSLAELYKQRAAIESQYADSLAKLARSAEQGGLLPKAGIEWDKSSGEGKLWDTVVNEISETSSSHSTLSAILKSDFEQPIRELPTKIVAWRRIGEQDAQLEKTLKDYEKTSTKLEKATSKSKSSKADSLSNELNEITSSLASLSPMVYASYQRLDEERFRALKEILVRWGTVRADISQRDGERAERAVAVLVSWESQDEVAAVGRRLGSGSGSTPRGGPAPPSLSSAASTPQSARRMSSFTSERNNDFSPRPAARQNGSSSNTNTPTTSFAGGLKSMLGRKGTLGPGRGRSNSNATSTRSGTQLDGAALAEEAEEPPARSGLPPPVDEEGFSVAPADRHRSPWDEPEESVPGAVLAPSLPNTSSSAVPSGGFSQTFASSPVGSSEDLANSTVSSQANAQPKLNLALASVPIQESEEERQAALQKMQQTLQMQPQPPSRRQTIARGRRDVRNTMFGPSTEIPTSLGDIQTPTENGTSTASRLQPSRQLSVASVSSSNPFDSPNLVAGLPSSFLADKATGLKANMIETINVIVREGKVQRMQINGEIHFSLRLPPNSTAAEGPIHIRMSDFERLEKIAPNPTYLAQVPDKPGEYFLNGETLASAASSASARGTLLFRYQVHIPLGEEKTMLPLLLEPAFRCADGDTRMILNYKRNQDSVWSKEGSVGNVSLVAAFGPGPSVSNVQAKPAGGVWSPSSRQMRWSLGEIKEDGKIIAKFISEPGQALAPTGVQASWVIENVLCSGIALSTVSGELETGLEFTEVKKAVTTGKCVTEPLVQ